MKHVIKLGLMLAFLVCIIPVQAATGQVADLETGDKNNEGRFVKTGIEETYASEYILGAGDVLEITTWKDESLSKVIPILPDGKIHFPLIGQVDAGGRTVSELRQEIEQRISVYVPDPYVGVSVQQINSMLIYVIGKVNHPGRFVLNSKINVLQVLSMAGGLNSFADGKKIRIIREVNGDQLILNFNYEDTAKGKDLSSNISLKRGDIIVVP
jgi:polysaccharide export outer membrane protein